MANSATARRLPLVVRQVSTWTGAVTLAAVLPIYLNVALAVQPDKLLLDAKGRPGLNLANVEIPPVAAKVVEQSRSLPPWAGMVTLDNDRLFILRSRARGEVIELAQREEAPDPANPGTKPKLRPLRFGDRVKQGELLAVVFSREIGQAKAALNDALLQLRLSKEALAHVGKLFAEGTVATATLLQAERQAQADADAVLKAERALFLLKFGKEEVKEVRDHAEALAAAPPDKKGARDPEAEARKLARVEIRVPKFGGDPKLELVVVERNVQVGDVVDPFEGPGLFRVADLRRLLVVTPPPEEHLALLDKLLTAPSKANAAALFTFEPNTGGPPLPLKVPRLDAVPAPNAPPATTAIAPPIGDRPRLALVAALDNPKGASYLVGVKGKVTVHVPAEPDTVEVPAKALLHQADGTALVFVQSDTAKTEYFLRRVVVVQRFDDVTWVRSKLTGKEIEQVAKATKQGDPPVEPLAAGAYVMPYDVERFVRQVKDLQAADKGGK
jgi:cobalt-zinc-cadmium efflux system membrane fusion protein